MREHRSHSKAPRTPSKPSLTQPSAPVPVLVVAQAWVAERVEDDGSKTVLPLPAWEFVDGDLLPLPRSLRTGWVVRPATEGDDRLIRNTAARMRPDTKTNNDWNRWRQNLWS